MDNDEAMLGAYPIEDFMEIYVSECVCALVGGWGHNY